jgi:hypothetical protein
MEESVKLTGTLHIVVRDEQGNIKEERYEKNLVVTTGLAYIASRMVGVASTVMSHMEVGTSNTSAALGQTALVAAVSGSRRPLTVFSSASNVVTAETTFAAGYGTGTLTEAGIFNASSGGTMMCRSVYSPVVKGATDSLTITWTITVS